MKVYHLLAAALLMTVACTAEVDNRLDVVPYPNEVKVRHGRFNTAGATFYLDEKLPEHALAAATCFAGRLSEATGQESSIASGQSRTGFVFIVDPSLDNEEYILDISLKAVVVKAADLNGFLYAIATLEQMLPTEFFSGKMSPEADWSVACVKIKDAPRFAYRGMHLDVARHFFSVEQVKKYLFDAEEMACDISSASNR